MTNRQTAHQPRAAGPIRPILPPLLAVALILWSSAAAAASPADRLIRQLSHGSLATRDAASSGLLALGPKALPAIEQAIPSATGEAAFRLPLIADAIALAETARRLEQPAAAQPGTIAGPLTVAVQQVDRLGTNGQRLLLLRVGWQPQLAPVLLRLPLASVVAEGPAGEAVPPLSRRGVIEPLLTTTRRWVELPIRLGPPPAGLAVLESLRGTIDCWLPGFAHRFTLPLPDLAADQPDAASSPAPTTSLGGVTVRCEAWSCGPTAAGRQARVRLSARFAEASEALASHRDWLADRHAELLLPTGEVVNAASHRVVSRSRQGLVVEAVFPLPDAGVLPGSRLAWRLPLGVTRVPFDFWLKSIPLTGPEREEK